MKTTILVFLTLCVSLTVYAQQVKLNINVTKIEPNKGTVVLNIYNKKEDFLKTVLITKTLKADHSGLAFVINLPKKGIYAVTIFQDLDDNKKLKHNWLGIPQEPVGYGNNFKPSTKPKFNECAITVDRDNLTQTITLY